jgi:hypothetical protein
VDDLGRPALRVEIEANLIFVHEFSIPETAILMSDEVKNVPQLRIGLLDEIMSDAIFIRMDQPLWKFFRWTTVLLLCREATLQCNTLYHTQY